MMNQEFKKAIQIVIKEIKNDEGLKQAYQANIAMSFYDAMRSGINEPNQLLLEMNAEAFKHKSWIQIHKISNQAAENFLNLWLNH